MSIILVPTLMKQCFKILCWGMFVTAKWL